MQRQVGRPRDPIKEEFWRRTIADHAQSNLPIQAYCRLKGLNARSFRSWRQELARRDSEVASTRTHERSDSVSLTSAFLPVRVVQDAPVATALASPIEILLPTGATVRVSRGFDPSTLDAVLSVLEARRC